MKNIIKTKVLLLFTICTSLFFIGCDQFLEETPITSVSSDFIYENGDGLEVGVNALYNLMRRSNAGGGFYDGDRFKGNVTILAGTDLGQTRTWHRPYGASAHVATSGAMSIKWNDGYEIIDRANAIISAAANISEDDNNRDYWVAQARIIRGQMYFDLLRMYDNIILDTVATTLDNFDDPVDYTVANPADVYELIDGDFDFAISHLAYDEPYGRYNKSVARLLKGKSAMWQGIWSEAATQFDAIINESGKSLVNLNQVFGDNLDHSETLFVYTRDEATGGAFSLAGGQPSHLSSFFNCRIYEQNSGAFIRSVEYGGDSLGWSAPNDYLQELYGELELPDPSKPWARHIVTDDLRYTTYFYPEVYVANNPDSPDFGKPIPVTDYEDNFRRYHFSLYKFHDNLTKAAATNDSWKDHLQYRLAEVYLLGAEAYFHMNGGTDATALKYINTIRRRAFTGVPNSTDTSHDFTSITLDTYLEESARELCFEGNRWYLLKRLGLLVERQGLHYRYGSNTGNIAPEPMAPYMVRFPIPQSFIDQSGGAYPQNEGY